MFFQNSVIKKYLAALDNERVAKAWEVYKGYFLNKEIQENIRSSKEEQFQEGFLRELFVKVLGYTLNPSPNFNLITEQKNENDAKKADGAILRDDKVIGVIELKDHKTTDLSHVERQAFGYKSQHKDTKYVVISNFEKLRFYIDNAVEHIEWNLFTLNEDDFRLLYFCLAWPNISTDLPLKAKQESVSNEDQITQQLYKDYSAFKREIFADILANNTDAGLEPEQASHADREHALLLFRKTQKLLDRLLFIFFAEDCGLLPPNSMVEILKQWEQLKEMDEYVPLYNRIKKYFGYMDTGWQGKKYEIFAYNGGLFKPDEVLDGIKISDDILARFTRKLADYDYNTEVDVNILGHIFENSLNEIEEVTAQINAGEVPTVSKRKRDGVFYTPQYITKYIVENTVGRLCAEKKAEMGLDEGTMYDVQSTKAKRKEVYERLQAYREWLLGITICDPACGSGAFLNAALQFLMAEHKLLDEMEAKITGSTIAFQAVENSILENNLYGVDINEESVEIARLALWLRTAKPHRKLNSLNNNIKCGNSLISDPEIAGEKAFDWQKEFPQVFEKGGFDVVIGNPPYLSLTQNNTDNKVLDFYKTAYKSIAKSNSKNLFTLFNEKGISLVKDKGTLSYIIPEGFLKTRSYQDCLNEMQAHGSIDLSMSFEDFVFADAVTGSLIFRYIKGVYDLPCSNLFMHRNHEITEIIEEENTVLTKFNSLQQVHKLSEICSLFKGMVVGDRKNSVSYDSSQPETFYLGNCISRYIFKDKFYCDYNQLKIIGGTSKKEKYDVAPRILIRRTGNTLCCVLLQEPALTESTLYSCYPIKSEYDIKYILALLNSALYTYVVQQKMVTNEQAFPQILMTDLEDLPIPECADQQPFIELADSMLALNKDLQAKRARFIRRLQDNMPDIKITGTLETFDTLDFAGFVTELKKQKIKLSLIQQDEWEEYFGQYKAALNEISAQIAATDKEIDERVYALYGLTEEEIKTIEG